MYGLKVTDGDIAVMGDGNVNKITGGERVTQELSHWLLEPLGTDTLYEKFGSTLWDAVGQPMQLEYIDEVRREVKRVVENYIAYQGRQVSEAVAAGPDVFMRLWPDSEIIDSLEAVSVSAVANTLHVTVKLRMTDGKQIVVTQES